MRIERFQSRIDQLIDMNFVRRCACTRFEPYFLMALAILVIECAWLIGRALNNSQ